MNNNNALLKYCIQKYNNSPYLKYLVNILIFIMSSLLIKYLYLCDTQAFIVSTLSFIISFAFSHFVLSRFKLSNNLFIKIIQHFLIIMIVYALILIFVPIFIANFSSVIHCDSTDTDTSNNNNDNINDNNKGQKTDDESNYTFSGSISVPKIIVDKAGDLCVSAEKFKSITNSFQSTDNLIAPDNLFTYILSFFRPVPVEGYLDDLIGQQLFIHFLLLAVVIGLILLFSVLIFIQIMVKNKDFITKHFKNKFILLFIKYQLFLSKISLFALPLLIMIGLLELFVGVYFIITHPIPYDKIPFDLHIYISK